MGGRARARLSAHAHSHKLTFPILTSFFPVEKINCSSALSLTLQFSSSALIEAPIKYRAMANKSEGFFFSLSHKWKLLTAVVQVEKDCAISIFH